MLYRSTHIRATYNTPERVGGLSQPSKVQCRVDKSTFFSYLVIGKVVELYLVKTIFFKGNFCNLAALLSELLSKRKKFLLILLAWFDFDADRSFQFSTPISDMFCAIVRRRPKTPFPKLQFKHRKFLEYFSSRSPFNRFYHFRNRKRWWKVQKQVNVLNFFCNHNPLFFFANTVNFLRKKLNDRPYQNMFSVLGTKAQMVGGLIDKISTMFNFNHKPIMRFLPLFKQEVSCASGVL